MLKTVIGASKYGIAADVYLEKIKPNNKENSTRAKLNLTFCKTLLEVTSKLNSLLLLFLFHITQPKIDMAIKNNWRAISKNNCV